MTTHDDHGTEATAQDADVRFVDLVFEIERTARHTVGVNEIEHLLVALLALLESGSVSRATAQTTFARLAAQWPHGAIEILEYTMRRLRWPEVRTALESTYAHAADFRHRDLARHALAVYEEVWEDSEIYATYRAEELRPGPPGASELPRPDIHGLPPTSWGEFPAHMVGAIVTVRVLCAHDFGVGVELIGNSAYGHVKLPRLADGRVTLETGEALVGQTVGAKVLAVLPGHQMTLTLRASDLVDPDVERSALRERETTIGTTVSGTVVAVFRWGVFVEIGTSSIGYIDPLYIDDGDSYAPGDAVVAVVDAYREDNDQYRLRPPHQVPLADRLRAWRLQDEP